MKKALSMIGMTILLFATMAELSAQTRGISYQAVARDGSGANSVLMANQNVNVNFKIREGSAAGTVVYEENHSPMTNAYALFSVVIGEGTVVAGDFATVAWGGNDHFLEVGINGASVGTTELNSVPYSKVATDMGIENLTDVNTAGAAAGSVLKFDGADWTVGTDETGQSPWSTSGSDIFYDAGNVGIGTSTPSTALHLSGTGNSHDITIDDQFPFITLNAISATGNSGITFNDQGNITGRIIHRASEDAIFISGVNGQSQPNLVVASTGNVGIGTGSPDFPLHITADTLSFTSMQIADLGSSNLGLDGDVVPYGGSSLGFDLGNNTATQHWDDVVANDFITFSDARLKNQIADLKMGLNEIMKLRPVQYRYNKDIDAANDLRFGLIAQEVEEVMPNIVLNEDVDVNPETGQLERKANDYKSMKYMELIPVLINAVQEQQNYIQKLEDRIKTLENKN